MMNVKKWVKKRQPASLYLVLVLSVVHFIAQMVICHVTHALTLLVDSCHMLCNIVALVGCILTLKYQTKNPKISNSGPHNKNGNETEENNSQVTPENEDKSCSKGKEGASKGNDERQLRNTFGWARIEVLMMLVVCVLFGSLCFSVLIEALQTLIHIDHLDAMHYPRVVFSIGTIGLFLNIFCYLTIGGYTFHQGSFLHVTESGDVVLDSVATVESVRQGQRGLSRSRRSIQVKPKLHERQGIVEITRDMTSCLFVIVCSLIIYFVNPDVAKYLDPALAILSALILLALTYPYLKESGLILLQTIPGTMNMETLNADMLKSFPTIVNIHDVHVWQLTTTKVVMTAHIIFLNPSDYISQCDPIVNFLLEQGITQVTIQPEFKLSNTSSCNSVEDECLMKCKGKGCDSKHCCNNRNSISSDAPSSIISADPKAKSSSTEQIESNTGSS
ncbi:zinc transporter 77C [Arctopsyche grandis]|uniref:zinc transporter 77C n=1 Tax=Arctopsyche grandis TaxID=121162 RepID=UPI00406D809F